MPSEAAVQQSTMLFCNSVGMIDLHHVARRFRQHLRRITALGTNRASQSSLQCLLLRQYNKVSLY